MSGRTTTLDDLGETPERLDGIRGTQRVVCLDCMWTFRGEATDACPLCGSGCSARQVSAYAAFDAEPYLGRQAPRREPVGALLALRGYVESIGAPVPDYVDEVLGAAGIKVGG